MLRHPTLATPAVRLAGDVSSTDIDWLCRMVEQALYVLADPSPANLRGLRRTAGSA